MDKKFFQLPFKFPFEGPSSVKTLLRALSQMEKSFYPAVQSFKVFLLLLQHVLNHDNSWNKHVQRWPRSKPEGTLLPAEAKVEFHMFKPELSLLFGPPFEARLSHRRTVSSAGDESMHSCRRRGGNVPAASAAFCLHLHRDRTSRKCSVMFPPEREPMKVRRTLLQSYLSSSSEPPTPAAGRGGRIVVAPPPDPGAV